MTSEARTGTQNRRTSMSTSAAGYMDQTADSDDWRFITDAKERKRIQNRLSQRNVRKKKKEAVHDFDETGETCQLQSRQCPSHQSASIQHHMDVEQDAERRRTAENPSYLFGDEPLLQMLQSVDEDLEGSSTYLQASAQPSSNRNRGFLRLQHPGDLNQNYDVLSGHGRQNSFAISEQSSTDLSFNAGFDTGISEYEQSSGIASFMQNELAWTPHQEQTQRTDFTRSSPTSSSKGAETLFLRRPSTISGCLGQHSHAERAKKLPTKEAALADVKALVEGYGLELSDLVESITDSSDTKSSSGASVTQVRKSSQTGRQASADTWTDSQVTQILADNGNGDRKVEKVVILYMKDEAQ